MDNYVKGLNLDSEIAESYYKSSFAKTEQQKFLESILSARKLAPRKIADVACGGGSLSFHLKQIYPQASFSLIDMNRDAVAIAQSIATLQGETISEGSIYDLEFSDNEFDLVFCWQTLFVLEDPKKGLDELVRITRPGGRVFLSSLFNFDSDVDIYARLVDHTRRSGQSGLPIAYNTYCLSTIENWLSNLVKSYLIHPFTITVDLKTRSRGLGTKTVECADGSRLQVSGGLLMQWGILEIEK